MFFPCSYRNVLCVTATDVNDVKSNFSSFYKRVDISAPGTAIYTTAPNGAFGYSGGTSFASPIVAGAAALVWSYFPALHPLSVAEHLKNTSDIIDTIAGNIIYQGKLGKGRLNMYRALTDTFKPAIKLLTVDITDNNDNIFLMNDTLHITGNFINYLAPTLGLNINLVCESPYVELIDSVYFAGAVSTMQGFSNTADKFIIKLLPGIPSSYDIVLKFEFVDSNYFSWDYYTFTVNIDYLVLNINKIHTTVTSKGTLGYNDNVNFQQGIGLSFENSNSLISCAGIMIGCADNKVSDNIYGVPAYSFDSDLIPVESIVYVMPPQKGQQHIKGVFNDDGAGTFKLNAEVIHHNYAYDEPGKENFITLEYLIVNKNTTPLSNIYVGFFADWELKVRSQNKANTVLSNRFGYVHSHDSSLYAGIQLLTAENFIHYAVDNNGMYGSVNISDGFVSAEKYIALSNTRNIAGLDILGNNVSSVVSTGPYTVDSGDTIQVAFALHAAHNYNELLQSVINAYQAWTNINPQINDKDNICRFIQVFPNPFSDEISIYTGKDTETEYIIIYDITGRLVYSANVSSENYYVINTTSLLQGIYFLHIYGKESCVKKLIKL